MSLQVMTVRSEGVCMVDVIGLHVAGGLKHIPSESCHHVYSDHGFVLAIVQLLSQRKEVLGSLESTWW